MAKILQFDIEMLRSCYSGLKTLAQAVNVTYGPKGRHVMVQGPMSSPYLLKDGAEVLKHVHLQNPFENVAAKIIKDACAKTHEIAGDGSTTSFILMDAIFSHGFKQVLRGANPLHLKKGMELAAKKIHSLLQEKAKPISHKKDLKKLALSHTDLDEVICELLSDCIDTIKSNGMVKIKQSNNLESKKTLLEGFQLDRGFASPYFVNKPDSMEVELKQPFVFITDEKIISLKELMPLFAKIHAQNRSLLIFAEDIDADALSALVVNKLKANFQICVIKFSSATEESKSVLQDIAVLSGATISNRDVHPSYKQISMEHLGKFEEVKISKDHSYFVKGAGNKLAIENRRNLLKNSLKNLQDLSAIKVLESRLEKFSSGIVTLEIGALSDKDYEEKKYKIEKTLNLLKKATIEGVLPGGGVAFIHAQSELKLSDKIHDVQVGIEIVKQACFSPAIQLACNSGQSGSSIALQISENKENFGYCVLQEKFCDFLQEGIVDPLFVLKTALNHAVSVAGLLLNTSSMMTEKR